MMGLIFFYQHFHHQSTSTQAQTNSTIAGPRTARLPGIGKPFVDGQLRVLIHHVHCGISRLGTGVATITAKGQFCAILLTLTNISKVAVTYDQRSDIAIDSAGRQFAWNTDDVTADVYGNYAAFGMFGQTINPSYSFSGNLYFEIPRGDAIKKVVLFTDSSTQLKGTTVQLAK